MKYEVCMYVRLHLAGKRIIEMYAVWVTSISIRGPRVIFERLGLYVGTVGKGTI